MGRILRGHLLSLQSSTLVDSPSHVPPCAASTNLGLSSVRLPPPQDRLHSPCSHGPQTQFTRNNAIINTLLNNFFGFLNDYLDKVLGCIPRNQLETQSSPQLLQLYPSGQYVFLLHMICYILLSSMGPKHIYLQLLCGDT